jgi:hypothetical protein
LLRKILLFLLFCCALCSARSQQQIEGVVTDHYSKTPLSNVTVYTSTQSGVISDSLGKYAVPVRKGDSIWFSYLGKETQRFAVDTITNTWSFNVELYVDARFLPAVRVKSSNYKQDSLQFRKDYAKAFNFKKPGISLSPTPAANQVPGSVSVGIDLDAIINMFRFKRNRQMAKLQERLLQQEQDAYVNHRFSRRYVIQITKLQGDELTSFINTYKPTYELLKMMNDYELGLYIQKCFDYSKSRKRRPTGNR